MFRNIGLALLCVASSLPAAEAARAATVAPVVDRDEFSTTIRLPDGRLRTSLSSQAVNFRDGENWKAVDTELEELDDGSVSPASVDGDVVIPASLGLPLQLQHDGEAVSFRLLGASGDAEVDGAEATFEDALSGVDARYAATPTGVKETLVLDDSSSPFVFRYEMKADHDWSADVVSGAVVLSDDAGIERYRVTAPIAWDSAPDRSVTNDLSLSIAKVADGRWTITLRPDGSWLADPGRRFPVFVDPDFSWASGTTHFHGAQDCYLSGNTQANNGFCAQTYLQTGYYNRPYKSIFRFDIAAAIPNNAIVSAAAFKAYAPPQSVHFAANHSLSTITSDWDASATWNSRKAGVPWTTAGGDVSSDPSLKSSSTAVQASSAWYSWSAPLAAVQGWVTGTLPNHGFLLQTDAGAPSNNAYVWASTEASSSSSFPATSNEWPTLDVTWSSPTNGDSTQPTAPTEVHLSDMDESGLAYVLFVEGEDPGVSPSGIDRTEGRFKIGSSNYGAWEETQDETLPVENLEAGDVLTVQLRSVDAAGNASATTEASFVASRTREMAAEIEAGADYLTSNYSMTAAQAKDWLAVQDRGMELGEMVSQGLGNRFAGQWFDNATRTLHIAVRGTGSNASIVSTAAYLGVEDALVIDPVTWSEHDLENTAIGLQVALKAHIVAQHLEVTHDVRRNAVVVLLSDAAPAAVQDDIDSATDGITIQPIIEEVPASRLSFETDAAPACSEGTYLSELWLTCSGPPRGSNTFAAKTALNQVEADYNTCTFGFLALQYGTAGFFTAGHCLDYAKFPRPAPLLDSELCAQSFALRSSGSGNLGREFIGNSCHGDKNIHFIEAGPDAGLILADVAFSELPPGRPWITVLNGDGASPSNPGDDTTRNEQYAIRDVGSAQLNSIVCSTLGRTRQTKCGEVIQRGNSEGNKAVLRGWCSQAGDSGSPVFKAHTAYGVVHGHTSGGPLGGCWTAFQGALTMEEELEAQVATVTRWETWRSGGGGDTCGWSCHS